jgi:excisionase family DNA binding protein
MDTAVPREAGTLTVKQAARETGLETWRLYRLFRDGAIPGYRARRSIRVLENFVGDLAAVLRSGRSADGHPLDVAEYGRQWQAAREAVAGEAVSA